MKRTIAVLVALAILGSASEAQDPKPLTKKGTFALMFGFSGMGNLGVRSPLTYGMLAKYNINDNLFIGIAPEFGLSTTTTKNTTTPPPAGQLAESKYSEAAYGVEGRLGYTIAQSGSIAFNLGSAIGIRWLSYEREGNSASFDPGFVEGHKLKEASTAFYIAPGIGFEWFAWENISLGAEVLVNLFFQSGKLELTRPAPAQSTSSDAPSTTFLGTGTSWVWIAIYL